MKQISRINALTMFFALTLPLWLFANGPATTKHTDRHARYKFVDLGTLGKPDSIVQFFESGVINNSGIIVGGADTSIPDPYSPNCFGPNCVVQHAFEYWHGLLRDLGGLPGTDNSFPWWINERGWIAGASQNGEIDPLTGGPEAKAVLWKESKIIDLGTLGGNQSAAFGVNNAGQITGFAQNAIPDPWGLVSPLGTQTRAFFWHNGTMLDIGTLGGPDSVGLYINEDGHIGGASFTTDFRDPATEMPPVEPFLWDGRETRGLGSLGGAYGQVWGLNNRDQVIGNSSTADAPGACQFVQLGCHAFLWERGVLKDLGTLGGTFSFPIVINEEGDVAGAANTANDATVRAVRWRNGVIKDLGGVGSDACSFAWGENNKGQIVGISVPMCDLALAPRAFLWEDGEMIDLNSKIPSDSNFQLVYAEAINERGEITGIGVPHGISPGDVESSGHAFVLVPCDRDDTDGCEDSWRAKELEQTSFVSSGVLQNKSAAEALEAFRARILARQHTGLRSRLRK